MIGVGSVNTTKLVKELQAYMKAASSEDYNGDYAHYRQKSLKQQLWHFMAIMYSHT
jgi:hypothetical protein